MKTAKFDKILLITLCYFLPYTFTYGQSKLPSKQAAGVWIPDNAKIDGKATEWNNQFMAYNRNTDVFYTVANSNEQLYIILQATDREIIKKIVDGGVTLTIKNVKNIKNNISFTFPITQTKGPLFFYLGAIDVKVIESEMKKINKLLTESHKLIKVTGVKGIGPLISIYNEKGIQAAESLDNKQTYTLEMAVNLNRAGLSLDGTKIFYQLKLNGLRNYEPFEEDPKVAAADGGEIPAEQHKKIAEEMREKFAKRGSPTYFEGEYTMAKKNN